MWWGGKVDDDGIVFCVQGTLLSVFLQPETKARKWKRERERDWGEGSDGKKEKKTGLDARSTVQSRSSTVLAGIPAGPFVNQ